MTEDEVRTQVWNEAKAQVKAGCACWSMKVKRGKQVRLKCPHCLKNRRVRINGEQPVVRRCRDCKKEFVFEDRMIEVMGCYGDIQRQRVVGFRKASVK